MKRVEIEFIIGKVEGSELEFAVRIRTSGGYELGEPVVL
jgi:hypothetical protein